MHRVKTSSSAQCAHTGHWLRPHCAQPPHCSVSQAWPGRVAAHAWPCRSTCSALSQHTPGRVAVHARPCRSARPAVAQCTPGRVAVHARPCRSARPAMSQLTPGRVKAHARQCRTPCCRFPGHVAHTTAVSWLSPGRVAACLAAPRHDTKIVSRDKSLRKHAGPCRARTGAVLWSCPRPYRGPGALYRDPKSPPQPRYKILYHDLLLARPRLHALPHAPTHGRPCRGPCLGRIVADLWPCRGRDWPCRGPCSCAQLPCVTIQSIVS